MDRAANRTLASRGFIAEAAAGAIIPRRWIECPMIRRRIASTIEVVIPCGNGSYRVWGRYRCREHAEQGLRALRRVGIEPRLIVIAPTVRRGRGVILDA
jgi:hypothetical protein